MLFFSKNECTKNEYTSIVYFVVQVLFSSCIKIIFFFLFFAAGNSVEVDESLFQEMDDLELEDEEDDPDYNPVNLDSD